MSYRQEVLATLREARRLLGGAGAWCQGTYARTARGDCARTCYAEDAVSWCAVGAVYRVSRTAGAEVVGGAIRALSLVVEPSYAGGDAEGTVTGANDDESTTLRDVLGWYDAAIASTAAVEVEG